MKLISVNDLSLQNEGYFAFKHVAFSLSQNEIIGLTGDSGSGKTQLLEALSNQKSPDSGVIEYTPGVRVGYMPQINLEIIDQSTGKYLEDIRKISKDLAVRKDQLQSMITFLGMSPYLDFSVRQLSAGLKKRVDFLAAVASHPNVLLLDEPFAFQNQKIIKNMLEVIQDLKDNGSGIIVASTQFNDFAKQYFDVQYSLENGNLLEKKVSDARCLLVFSVYPNSVAITKDIKEFVITSANDKLELEVPLSIKESMIERLTQLNYRLEEAQNVES